MRYLLTADGKHFFATVMSNWWKINPNLSKQRTAELVNHTSYPQNNQACSIWTSSVLYLFHVVCRWCRIRPTRGSDGWLLRPNSSRLESTGCSGLHARRRSDLASKGLNNGLYSYLWAKETKVLASGEVITVISCMVKEQPLYEPAGHLSILLCIQWRHLLSAKQSWIARRGNMGRSIIAQPIKHSNITFYNLIFERSVQFFQCLYFKCIFMNQEEVIVHSLPPTSSRHVLRCDIATIHTKQ